MKFTNRLILEIAVGALVAPAAMAKGRSLGAKAPTARHRSVKGKKSAVESTRKTGKKKGGKSMPKGTEQPASEI